MNVKKKIFDLVVLAARSTCQQERLNASAAAGRLAARYKISIASLLRTATIATMGYRELLLAVNPERET